MSNLDLEQQRKRSKDLIRAHRRGDVDAARRIQTHLPRATALSLAQVGALSLQLAEAQLVIAREAGFPTWPRLKRHVERSGRSEEVPALHEAVRAGDIAAVRAALPTSMRWQTREALQDAIASDRRDIVAVLLEHRALVDRAGRQFGRWGGAVHTALLLRRGVDMTELLLRGGASIAARDRDGRTPLAIAVRTGDDASAEALRRAGASDDEVDDIDRSLGRTLGGGTAHGASLPAGARLRRSDHQHVSWAIRRGRPDAVPALLALGLDPNIPDDDGETPLHLAAAAGSLGAIDALLDAGARIDARNYRDEPALVHALRAGHDAAVSRLAAAGATLDDGPDLTEVFEEAADAVVAGQLGRLRTLLDRHPRLVTMRSTRSHHATLLHYTGSNGVEQERQRTPKNIAAIVDLLVARGADPDALAFTYGGGSAQTTVYLAFTSCHPEQAGVMTELIEALVRGGAHIDSDDRDTVQSAQRSAIPTLVAAGARVDLWIAAVLGRIDDVRRFVAPDGTLQPGAKIGSEASVDDGVIIANAFREACRSGYLDVVTYLHAAGARVDTVDDEGMTPLHCASWHGHLEVARFLVAHGAALEAKNVYGGTVLDMVLWAIDNQPDSGAANAAVIQFLVDAGADVDAAGGRDVVAAAIDACRPRA